ncbi:MAG: class I SAM-dependent methyltransferase family protein [Candidatus Odinarchaeota archaeon]
MKSKEKTRYIKVKKQDAQIFLNFVKKKHNFEKVIDRRKQILSESDFVLFPLIENNDILEMLTDSCESNFRFEIISTTNYSSSKKIIQSLEIILKDKLPQNVFDLLPKSYDIIGHIAIVEFDRFNVLSYKKSIKYKKEFAKALIIATKAIKAVYEKKSKIKGKFRLRELKLLSGKDKSETIHKENHCLFKLNIKKTYFTPRLVFERRRLSMYNLKENELIIDMFAGVGPFSIQLAKNNDVVIYAFDINPYAYKYLKENIELNKLKGVILPFNIDIKKLLKPTNNLGNKLKNKANRIIMNLPEKSIEFVDIACFLMKLSGGILHIYQFSEKNKPIEKAIDNLSVSLKKYYWCIYQVINSKVVKAYSPKIDLVVIDALIKPIEK